MNSIRSYTYSDGKDGVGPRWLGLMLQSLNLFLTDMAVVTCMSVRSTRKSVIGQAGM